jgi:putative NADH-flavin reductase
MTLDPIVQVALIGLVGTILTLLMEGMRRQHKALGVVRDHAEAARFQVQNSHETNLRDDLDQMHDDVRQILEVSRSHGYELGHLRRDLQQERAERSALSDRVTDLAKRLPPAA